MEVPGSRPTGKRRKPAAAARILASGLATSGFFGIVATIAHQQASADARARQAMQAKAPTQAQTASVTEAPAQAPRTVPIAPALVVTVGAPPTSLAPSTTIVLEEIHRTTYIDQFGSSVPDPSLSTTVVAETAPPTSPPTDLTAAAPGAAPTNTTPKTVPKKRPSAPAPAAAPVLAPRPVSAPAPRPVSAPAPRPAPAPVPPPCQGSKCA